MIAIKDQLYTGSELWTLLRNDVKEFITQNAKIKLKVELQREPLSEELDTYMENYKHSERGQEEMYDMWHGQNAQEKMWERAAQQKGG